MLLIFVYVQSVYGGSEYGCTTPEKFNESNLEYFADLKKYIPNGNLFQFLISKSEHLGKGTYGEVKIIIGGKEKLVVKIITITYLTNKENIKREVAMNKQVCGKTPDIVYPYFIDCEGNETTPYKGCVEKHNFVYIFLRRAFSDLDSSYMLKKYRRLGAIQRAVVMLKVLEKVGGLHKKGIVHSDIKPANIMTKDSELQEFELADLGFADYKNEKFHGGTRIFYPPEIRMGIKILTPEVDIYALAITFLILEGGFRTYYKNMPRNFFYMQPTLKSHNEFLKVIPTVFSYFNRLKVLIPVFMRALDYTSSNRYSSVEEFSMAIVMLFEKIPNHRCYLFIILNEKEKNTEKKDQQTLQNFQTIEDTSTNYDWKVFARKLGYSVKPLSFFQRLVRKLPCGSNNRASSPIKIVQQEDINVVVDEDGKKCIECVLGNNVNENQKNIFLDEDCNIAKNLSVNFEDPVFEEDIPNEKHYKISNRIPIFLQINQQQNNKYLKNLESNKQKIII